MHRTAPTLAALLIASLAAPAWADEDMPARATALPFTYEMFEAAVPHTDLAVCPLDLTAEGRFCRVALFNDAFHIFVFTEEGDQPMIGFKSYDAELMTGLFD